jgi:hypothetical protein
MSGVKVNNGVINYGGIPSQGAGLLANRPAAGVLGRLFIGTDTNAWYRDTGSAWVLISAGITGSAAAGQVTFWGTATTISGDNGLFWDNTTKRLGINTITPGVRLDVHGAGVIQQLNGTGVNNSYLDFQNSGVTQWRIGNTVSTSIYRFGFFNASGTSEVASILQNGNFGINTITPSALLQILRGTSGNISSFTSNAVLINEYAGITIHSQTVSGVDWYGSEIRSINTVSSPGALNPRLAFFTQNLGTFLPADRTEKISILGDGKTGIGYTAPASLFAVAGSALINTNTANALYELFVNGNTYTGGLSPTIATQSTSVAMTRTQTGYVCTATLTLTLPAVSGLNNFYIVVANTGATVTVQRAGTDTILDKLGVSQTSVIVAAGTRSMFYVGGGSITYQIF